MIGCAEMRCDVEGVKITAKDCKVDGRSFFTLVLLDICVLLSTHDRLCAWV